MRLATNTRHVEWALPRSFKGQRSKVKVTRVQIYEYQNGGGIHFDGEADLFIQGGPKKVDHFFKVHNSCIW